MKMLLPIVLFCCVLIACKKENTGKTFCMNAAVKWGGDPAADGLGWYLLDSVGGAKTYITSNLPDSLKIDGLSVETCLYKTNEQFLCECVGPVYKYHLTSIKKH